MSKFGRGVLSAVLSAFLCAGSSFAAEPSVANMEQKGGSVVGKVVELPFSAASTVVGFGGDVVSGVVKGAVGLSFSVLRGLLLPACAYLSFDLWRVGASLRSGNIRLFPVDSKAWGDISEKIGVPDLVEGIISPKVLGLLGKAVKCFEYVDGEVMASLGVGYGEVEGNPTLKSVFAELNLSGIEGPAGLREACIGKICEKIDARKEGSSGNSGKAGKLLAEADALRLKAFWKAAIWCLSDDNVSDLAGVQSDSNNI